MEANNTYKTYGIKSTFAQLLAVLGLFTLQIGLGAGEMFYTFIKYSDIKTKNLFSGLFCACKVLGCVQSALLLGRFGHRKCVALACAEFLIAGLGSLAVADDVTWAHVAGACAMTFSVGASVGPCFAYVGETCEPWLRSTVCAAMIALEYGGFLAFVLASGQPFEPSAFPVVVVAVITIVAAAIAVFKMPDSPIWLLTKDENVKARRTLGKLRANNSDVACDREFQEIVNYVLPATGHNALITDNALTDASHAINKDDDDCSSPWKQLLRPEVLRPFCRMIYHLIIMTFLFKMHFYNRLHNIIEVFSNEKKGERDYVWWLYLPLIGYVVTTLLVNKVGKRHLTLISLSVTSVICIIYSFLTAFQCKALISNEVLKEYLFDEKDYILNVTIMLGMSIGIVPNSYMLIVGVFPVKSRYITCNICFALIFMVNSMSETFYFIIMYYIKTATFKTTTNNPKTSDCYDILPLIIGILGITECFVLYFYQKETENRSLREIYKILK